MTEAVIVALITGALSLLGVLISNRRAAADTDAKLDKHLAVTDTKLDELTREVRAHNNFAQRVPVLEEKVKVMNHRIEDLEKAPAKQGRADRWRAVGDAPYEEQGTGTPEGGTGFARTSVLPEAKPWRKGEFISPAQVKLQKGAPIGAQRSGSNGEKR